VNEGQEGFAQSGGVQYAQRLGDVGGVPWDGEDPGSHRVEGLDDKVFAFPSRIQNGENATAVEVVEGGVAGADLREGFACPFQTAAQRLIGLGHTLLHAGVRDGRRRGGGRLRDDGEMRRAGGVRGNLPFPSVLAAGQIADHGDADLIAGQGECVGMRDGGGWLVGLSGNGKRQFRSALVGAGEEFKRLRFAVFDFDREVDFIAVCRHAGLGGDGEGEPAAVNQLVECAGAEIGVGFPVSLLQEHDPGMAGSEVEPQRVVALAGVGELVVDIGHHVLDEDIGAGFLEGQKETVVANGDGRVLQGLQAGEAFVANADAAAAVEEPQHAVAKGDLAALHAERFRREGVGCGSQPVLFHAVGQRHLGLAGEGNREQAGCEGNDEDACVEAHGKWPPLFKRKIFEIRIIVRDADAGRGSCGEGSTGCGKRPKFKSKARKTSLGG